jgi:hypothetical protein
LRNLIPSSVLGGGSGEILSITASAFLGPGKKGSVDSVQEAGTRNAACPLVVTDEEFGAICTPLETQRSIDRTYLIEIPQEVSALLRYG